MGTPKALLLFDGEPLITHVARTLQRLFGDIVVVAAPDQELPALPARIVRDEVAYQGPVGGMYYGLKAAAAELSFVVSCDSAFLNTALISYLLSEIPDHDIVVPHWEGRFQPLHAVYRRSVLPHLETQLARGELRPIYLFDKVRTRRIDEDAIRRFDPEGWSFFNMNTPEDYAQALAHWTAGIACSVELFGAARLLAQTREVSLVLPSDATFSQLFAALADRFPVLVGRVITPDRSALVDGYVCNVNGRDFVRETTAKVQAGDTVLILSADAGG